MSGAIGTRPERADGPESRAPPKRSGWPIRRPVLGATLEASTGIEPVYTDLQSAA